MTLYISPSLRSTHAPGTALIIWVEWAGELEVAYKHTPILQAALELHLDRMDAAALTGQLPADRLDTVINRMACVWESANANLDPLAVQRARGVLAGRPDALAWVIGQYVERMGGREVVEELERLARRDVWGDGPALTDVREPSGQKVGAGVGAA